MRVQKWVSLPLILCLMIGPVPTGLVESAVDEPILESVESIPEAVEIDLGVDTDTIDEITEDVSEAEAGLCYARLSASTPLFVSLNDAEPACAAGGGVALVLDRRGGRAKIAFASDAGAVEYYADERALSFLSDGEVNAFLDALAASGAVALHRGDLNRPLDRVALTEIPREAAAVEEAPGETGEDPGMTEEGPETAQEAPETAGVDSEPAEEEPEAAGEAPEEVPGEGEGPETAEESPETAGVDSETAEETPETAEEGSEIPEEEPETAGEAPEEIPEEAPEAVGEEPAAAEEAPEEEPGIAEAEPGAAEEESEITGEESEAVEGEPASRAAEVVESAEEEDSNADALAGTEVVISYHPQDAVVAAGDTVSFTVKASGTGLHYQWQWRDGGAGTWTDTALNGCNAPILSFTVQREFHGRQYRCVVTNSYSRTAYSSAAQLMVYGVLRLSEQPSACAVGAGETARFRVTAVGTGVRYQWQWRAGSTGSWANTTLGGYNTAALSFAAQSAFNGRQYRCLVRDGYGNALYSGAASLEVRNYAKITAQPRAVAAGTGRTASFTVGASGDGIRYQWQWRAGSTGSWANTTLNGCRTATLSFAAQSAFNGREYRCVVTDRYGRAATSSGAALEVRNYAAVTEQPTEEQVANGTVAKFTVKASGDGIRYQWQWRAGSSGSWTDTTLSGWNTDTLKFTAQSAFNGRQYRCAVTDRYGTTACSAAAALEVRNYAAITAQPSNLRACVNHAAVFSVGASGDGIRYQWQWRSGAFGNWANTAIAGCDTARLSVTAQPAFDGRQYRCAVTDRYGTSVYSSAATLTVYGTDGWVSAGGAWYYYQNGALVTGWKYVGGKWYYLASDGRMVTGWQRIDGQWYYFQPSGEMTTGWLRQGDGWYYLKSSGEMVTGWQKINGVWYYFTRSGRMAEDSDSITLSLSQTQLKLGKSEVSTVLKARYDSHVEEGDITEGLTWTSSRTDVVKVNAATGAMTALDTGSAVVTAATPNGLTASCSVTVVKAPSKVTISPSSMKLQVGESSQYTAALPSGSAGGLSWSSSDPSVAAIDDHGVVSGLKVGTAEITVTTYNGMTSTSSLQVQAPSGTVTDGEAVVSTTSQYREDMTNAEKIEYVIYVAQTKLGKPYVYGSFGPNSFDCSGFTTYCYRQIGVELKHSAYTQGYDNSQQKISDPAQLKRGDIVCFDTVSDSDLCDHTGIYLGNGKFVHASSSAKKVIISTLATGYYQRAFSWGRRVL